MNRNDAPARTVDEGLLIATLQRQESLLRGWANALMREVKQSLALGALEVQRAAKEDAIDAVRSGLAQADAALRLAMQSVTTLAEQAYPQSLDALGLSAALESLAGRFAALAREHGAALHCLGEGDRARSTEDVPQGAALALYRLVEAVLEDVRQCDAGLRVRIAVDERPGRPLAVDLQISGAAAVAANALDIAAGSGSPRSRAAARWIAVLGGTVTSARDDQGHLRRVGAAVPRIVA